MPSALVLIANGTEEMEFTITFDTLVRGGVKTTSAFVPDASDTKGVNPPTAKGSRGISFLPDSYLELSNCGPDKYDLLVIPGGAKGAETISRNHDVQELVKRYIAERKLVGMICAGTLAASTARLSRQPLTSHPSVKAELMNDFEYSEEPVVISDNLVTSRGPGTAFPFALTLVELLCGADRRAEIRAPMMFPSNTPF